VLEKALLQLPLQSGEMRRGKILTPHQKGAGQGAACAQQSVNFEAGDLVTGQKHAQIYIKPSCPYPGRRTVAGFGAAASPPRGVGEV